MAIRVAQVSKGFRARDNAELTEVLDAIDFTVDDASVVAVFGPNGCGKSTLLNVVSGVYAPDTGDVQVAEVAPERVRLGYALQNFRDSLLPWESALNNVAFGLRAIGVERTSARRRAREFVEEHGLGIPLDRYPYQLSAGQQQLVALARTLIQKPANLLLDEPFIALDHEARFRIQDHVELMVRSGSATMIFVSHDIDEALYMSDKLILLSRRPARILSRFEVPFPHPRSHELLTSSAFSELRNAVIGEFIREVGG